MSGDSKKPCMTLYFKDEEFYNSVKRDAETMGVSMSELFRFLHRHFRWHCGNKPNRKVLKAQYEAGKELLG